MEETCTDENGNLCIWNRETAKKFEGKTEWDGSNHISVSTGNSWEDENLFLTKNNNWILTHSSACQGGRNFATLLNQEDAATWLLKNNYVTYVKEHMEPEFASRLL